MRILFLMKYFEIGGIEVVTSILSKKFINENNNVCIVSLNCPNSNMLRQLDKRIKFYTLNGYNIGTQNKIQLRRILEENKIDIIINQWGLPFIPIKLIKKASHGLGCKIISVYHNDPKANSKILDCVIKKQKNKKGIVKNYFRLKEKIYAYITGKSMKYVYKNSDKYVILSRSFIKNFKDFTKQKDINKLTVITNPVTIPIKDFVFSSTKKKKQIIYVGRIDYNQKRVNRVINIWKEIYKIYPDWSLKIIGDGPDKHYLEEKVKKEEIKNISFEGFQNPTQYYKEASILLLTSEYEGFGLVIVEAMQFGVVPIVYGSYNAIYDIITDQKNGFIIPPKYNHQFDQDLMIQRVKDLIESESLRKEMADKAIMNSKRFSINKIYTDWNNLFTTLVKTTNNH